MARKKVNLAWIKKDSARRATYKKRKRGLLKKVSELSTLCGVQACAIIYGSNEPMSETWPPTVAAVKQVIHRFCEMPQVEKSKKMLDQEGFLCQRISKMKEQLSRITKENRDLELKNKLIRSLSNRSALSGVGIDELHTLAVIVEGKLAKLRGRSELAPGSFEMALPPPAYSMALPPPLVMPGQSFPIAGLKENERGQLHFAPGPSGHVYEDNNYLDFLVNLENYPTEWNNASNNMHWNHHGPHM